MISSEWLAAFVAFADDMNFTRAAERLHISQPALHVQIKKLGESLGVPLYVRRGRSLELTVEGRKLLAYGREQSERATSFMEELKQGSRSDTVALAAGEGTFLYLVPDAIRAFRRDKSVKLRVLTRDHVQAVAAVRLGEAHLAVTVIDEVPDVFVARPVARVGAAVLMPKGHALARYRSVSVKALEGEPLVVPAEGRPLRLALARAWADAAIPWAPAVEANGWELIMRFAQLGLGLAIVNDFCQPPKGMVIRPMRDLPSVQYQLLRLRERKQTDAVKALESAILAVRSGSRS